MNLDEASKTAWRARQRTTLKAVTPAERTLASQRVRERLLARPEWRNARRLLLYSPLKDELDVWPLAEKALREGKTICLPRFMPERGEYEVCRIENIGKELISGHYGIMEPCVSCASVPLDCLDLALVPGLGFSRDGYRLGRGQGFYDRLLARMNGLKCGVGYDWQMGILFAAEPHDVSLNCIISPSHWWSLAAPGTV
jgi:5-formyltetrahydrofolate cyclo-ligase